VKKKNKEGKVMGEGRSGQQWALLKNKERKKGQDCEREGNNLGS